MDIRKIFVIFHAFAEKPLWTDLHEIWHGGHLVDVINCIKFFGDRFRGFDSARGRISAISIDLGCRR